MIKPKAMETIKIERKNVGFGKYQWYLNNKVCELSESEIFDLFSKEQQQKIFSQLDYYGSVNLEFELNPKP